MNTVIQSSVPATAREGAIPPSSSVAGEWRRAGFVFAVGMAIILAAFWPSWRLLGAAWAGSETYSHGFLIAPVSAWLVWRSRARLARIRPAANLLGLGVLAAAVSLWALGEISEVNIVRFVAVVSMVPGLVLLCFGWTVSWTLAFPLAFLFFMVPLGEGLVPWLMEATADATVAALRLSGVPVLREGLHFALPTGRWSVVEACSGLRYMVAALVLSTFFAYLNFRRFWKGAVFVLAALAVSIVANWARAYLVVMVGHLSNMRYGTGDDHVVYGWVFFGVVMTVIFWMGARFSDLDRWDEAPAIRMQPVAGGWRRAVAGIAGFVAVIAFSSWAVDEARDVVLRSDAASVLSAGLRPTSARQMDIQPAFQGASTVVQGELGAPMHETGAVQFYVGYFARQHETGEMVRWGNQVLALDDRRWGTFARRSVVVQGETQSFDVQERLVRSGTDERLMWSWYTVAGRSTASDRMAKLLTLWAMLSGKGDHSTVNVLLVPVGTDRAAAQAQLQAQARVLDSASRALTSHGRQR